MTWTPERRLATLTGGGKTVSYAYDMDGIRTSKTVNGTTTSYTTVSGQVVRETTGSSVIDFAYEDTGAPYAMRYNGSIYYYLLNLQGDVVGLVDAYGNTVASYSYDAWGNVLSATGSLAAINPLRYRGYYYDSETALYYVSSRYYDPMVGRWISADGQISGVGGDALGYNMFVYCLNNPVRLIDKTGMWPSELDFLRQLLKPVVQAVSTFVKQLVSASLNVYENERVIVNLGVVKITEKDELSVSVDETDKNYIRGYVDASDKTIGIKAKYGILNGTLATGKNGVISQRVNIEHGESGFSFGYDEAVLFSKHHISLSNGNATKTYTIQINKWIIALAFLPGIAVESFGGATGSGLISVFGGI